METPFCSKTTPAHTLPSASLRQQHSLDANVPASTTFVRGHIKLTKSEVAGKRIFVVGDVHGCYDQMLKLLNKAGVLTADRKRVANDSIVIFVGDIVNRGPDNLKVLRWVRHSGALCVVGNHELNVLEKGAAKYPWSGECTTGDLAYLRRLPYTVSIPAHGVVVVHAGLLPHTPLHHQRAFVMTRMRNIAEDATGRLVPLERAKDGGRNWAAVWNGPEHVIYGHDAKRGKDVYGRAVIQEHRLATGLDSRCVKKGKVSGIFVGEAMGDRTFVQVSCKHA
ncbi:Bis(5'-nucleosyl)-tetraphosphatase PrpE [asymmetrical] [Lamellibrachia satsuma]|nr:Bis(5'-nucleosyl)-tetraphosphatase PrpE [asymmetrical] [Lamellibrachia satsuma]